MIADRDSQNILITQLTNRPKKKGKSKTHKTEPTRFIFVYGNIHIIALAMSPLQIWF